MRHNRFENADPNRIHSYAPTDRAPREGRDASGRPIITEGAAEAELRWRFGSGPSSAAGDLGLRSPTGTQLELAKNTKLKRPRRAPTKKGEQPEPVGVVSSVTADTKAADFLAAEDRMINGIACVEQLRAVDFRLSQLSLLNRQALRLRLAAPDVLPGVSALVLLTATAREAWGRKVAKIREAWLHVAEHPEAADLRRPPAESVETVLARARAKARKEVLDAALERWRAEHEAWEASGQVGAEPDRKAAEQLAEAEGAAAAAAVDLGEELKRRELRERRRRVDRSEKAAKAEARPRAELAEVAARIGQQANHQRIVELLRDDATRKRALAQAEQLYRTALSAYCRTTSFGEYLREKRLEREQAAAGGNQRRAAALRKRFVGGLGRNDEVIW